MKLRLIACLGAVCLAAASAATVAPGAAAPVGCTRLVLTGHPSYPPVSWSANGTLEGAGIDLVRRLAKDAGLSITLVDESSWDGAQLAVRQGKADAIVGIYLTPPRAKFLDYVRPAFAPDPSAIVARDGEAFAYTSWNSLIGKRGVASAGEGYGHTFDTFIKTKLKMRRVSGFDAVYRAVLAGQADYGLVGTYAAQSDAPKGIKIVNANFVTEGLYVAFGKSSPCAAKVATFSKDVARLVADGTVKRLMDSALVRYRSRSRAYSSPSK